MRAKVAGLVMAALLLLYLVVVAQYAILLIGTPQPVGRAMGVALLVLPVIGAWALAVELVFALRGERLIALVSAEGPLPADGLARLASGRPDPAAADERFAQYRAEAEASPQSWRAWCRLSLAYDASGDRKRARWAMREAIRLSRSTPRQ